MMKQFQMIMLCAAAAMVFSCKGEKQEPDEPAVPEESPVLTTATESVSFDSDGSYGATITFTTNVGLSIVSIPDWITTDFETVEVKSGETLAKPVKVYVTLKASSHLSHEDRSGDITVCGTARKDLSVKVGAIQSKCPYRVSFTTQGRYQESPLFSGSEYSGTILWGDGSAQAKYQPNQIHKFSTSGEHTVSVSINDGSADKVRLEGLKNITRIDLRAF